MNRIWQKQIENNNLFHAYILSGRQQESLRAEIDDFICKLSIQPVDVSCIESIESIKIAQIRDFTKRLYIKPHSSKLKIAIIKNADKITIEAANKLLKIIEEPPQSTIFILTSLNEKNILPTVSSRCQKISIFSEININPTEKSVKLIKDIISGNVAKKFMLASGLSQDEDISKLFDNWLIYLHNKILQNPSVLHNIKEINKYKKVLKYNINKKLLLENLFLGLS